MKERLTKLLSQNDADLNEINNQRRYWLLASSVVFISIVILIFSWDWITNTRQQSLWWVFISILLIVSVNWWYWTMQSLTTLINRTKDEFTILSDVVDELADVKVILHCKQTVTGEVCDNCPSIATCRSSKTD